MSLNQDPREEAIKIFNILKPKFSDKIDGKSAILEMKQKNMNNWKQMEWQGWYFEDIGRDELIKIIGGNIGPSFGRTTFDFIRNYVWDLKLHSIYDTNGKQKPWLVLNDKEAIEAVIHKTGGLGFIIANAEMTFDHSGEFKKWHDNLKGGKSSYEIERIERGAPSRMRKTSFKIKNWESLFFNDFSQINEGTKEGWIEEFQTGMRNSNGSPRRPKVMIDVDSIPKNHLIAKL